MKLIVVHVTGLAGTAREELDGRTLLEASHTDSLDGLARRGSCGTARPLPEGAIAGAGAELLGLLGYLADGAEPPPLGALEALAVGAPLYPRDVAFRVNLSSCDDSGVLADTTGAGLPEEHALSLMAEIDERLSTRALRFYPGRDFAHVMVCTDGPSEVRCMPAPAAQGQPIEEVMPEGEGDGPLQQLIWDSLDILEGHRINHERREEGLPPVNVLWPWAPGRPPELRHFALRTGLRALAIADRLEVIGAATAAGVPTRRAPRAPALRVEALVSAAQGHDLSYLHVDLRDWFERPEEPETWVEAARQFDTEVVGRTLNQVRSAAEAMRLLVVGTWPEARWEERPEALWAAFPALKGHQSSADLFSEAAVGEEGLVLAEVGELLRKGLSDLG
jgi:2,3-bisphosphoglycerate-independent phosphoglycerate mutase